MEFSEKLQQLRTEKGLTQEQLAEKLYVSRTAISKWESGRGSLTTVFGIAELTLQNLHHQIWLKNKTMVSLFVTVFGTMLFIVSPQPYAAAFMLCLLVMKGVLLIKRQ